MEEQNAHPFHSNVQRWTSYIKWFCLLHALKGNTSVHISDLINIDILQLASYNICILYMIETKLHDKSKVKNAIEKILEIKCRFPFLKVSTNCWIFLVELQSLPKIAYVESWMLNLDVDVM